MDNKELIRQLGRKVKDGSITWSEAAKQFNVETGTDIKGDNLRCRYKYINDDYVPAKEEKVNQEYETHLEDGTIEISKEIWFDPYEEKTPEMILKKFGYSIEEFEIISWTFGKWEVAIKGEDNRICTTIRARIKPKKKIDLSIDQCLNIAKEVFNKNIKPIKITKKKKENKLVSDKLMELTGIELHLGKLAFESETGQEYNTQIAKDRFYKILEEITNHQEVEQCDTCLLCIGNDFFNSDTSTNTTTKGTQQYNDTRWKEMFETGLKMYVEMLLTLRDKFNHIEVRLQGGNHDKMSSYYLYIALSCYFNNDEVIRFSSNVKDIQCFIWGKDAIFFTHGESNLKRLIKSIPCEFYEEWGKSIYRELHLGHLHKEVVVDDDSGMITRRVGSPTGTDSWHYTERYIGVTQKYQIFIWNKQKGLENIRYINFENGKKKLIK